MTNERGTEAGKRTKRQAERDRKRQVAADYQWLMGAKAGRRLVWSWIVEAGIYQGSYRGHVNDCIFAEGRRAFGLKIVDELQAFCPELYDEMSRENRRTSPQLQNRDHDDDDEPDTSADTGE